MPGFGFGFGFGNNLHTQGGLLNGFPNVAKADGLLLNSVQPATINQVSITCKVKVGKKVYVDWGNDVVSEFIANGHDSTVTSTYTANSTTYNISVYGQIGAITKFVINTEPTVSGLNIDHFALKGFSLLTYLELIGTGTLTGSIDNLPLTLLYLNLTNVGTSITGIIDNLPNDIYNLELTGAIAGGSISNAPTSLFRLYLNNKNYSGNIHELPTGIVILEISSCGTLITGSVDNFNPKMTICKLSFTGTNYTGSIDNIPKSVNELVVWPRSKASIIGTVNSFAEFTNLTYLYLNGAGDLTGNFESIKNTITSTLIISNCGTEVTYGGGIVPSWSNVTLQIQTGLSTLALDNFLIAWASTAGVGTKAINLAGTNSPRSAASDAAVVTLQGKGKTFTFNI